MSQLKDSLIYFSRFFARLPHYLLQNTSQNNADNTKQREISYGIFYLKAFPRIRSA